MSPNCLRMNYGELWHAMVLRLTPCLQQLTDHTLCNSILETSSSITTASWYSKNKHPCITETPLRTELRKCFIEAVKPVEAEKKKQQKHKVPLIHQDKALTSDEVLERLRKEELENQIHLEEKRKEKRKNTSITHIYHNYNCKYIILL